MHDTDFLQDRVPEVTGPISKGPKSPLSIDLQEIGDAVMLTFAIISIVLGGVIYGISSFMADPPLFLIALLPIVGLSVLVAASAGMMSFFAGRK
jgi:hypothetical protein